MINNLIPKKYREYLGLGAEIAFTLTVPMLLGYFADRYFEISPWGILSGILLGMVLFILMMMRIARKLGNDRKQDV